MAENKKSALLYILRILQDKTDAKNPITQVEIAEELRSRYGIKLERKAIGRDISILKDAGYKIEQMRSGDKKGTYLKENVLEDEEARYLIDSIIESKHIPYSSATKLIKKITGLAYKGFINSFTLRHIYKSDRWPRTDNSEFFNNIKLIDEAINRKKQIEFSYNKYGIDKKLHVTKIHKVSPYQFIFHNQNYYLMGQDSQWHNLGFYHVDHITNLNIVNESIDIISTLPEYKDIYDEREGSINYKTLTAARPFMFTDKPERTVFIADKSIIDQIIYWFGKDITMFETKKDPEKVYVEVVASQLAMEYWALQYLNHVEIKYPYILRDKIKESLKNGMEKYDKES